MSRPDFKLLLPLIQLGCQLLTGNTQGASAGYPRHWGNPPAIQTRDLVPLPGGYGTGSSTLAAWIQRNLDRDARSPNIPPAVKRFPAHWGPPPPIQTRDYRPLPGGYGRGSSTLARWIQMHMDRDATASTPNESGSRPTTLYAAELQPGRLPMDLFVLDGDFTVMQSSTGPVLEVAAAPLKNYGLLFGPDESTNVLVQANARGQSNGRRHPVFSIGLGGVSGHQLRVAPARRRIELVRQNEVVAEAPFRNSAEEWIRLEIRARRLDGKWHIEGRAWPQGDPAPEDWPVRHVSEEAPPHGRASLWGEPFAEKPIQFNGLKVFRAQP